MTTWHKGPPPSCGWWPCRGPGNYFVLRWWDGQRWSRGATRLDDALAAAWLAARPESDWIEPRIEWTERPDRWPERSRT